MLKPRVCGVVTEPEWAEMSHPVQHLPWEGQSYLPESTRTFFAQLKTLAWRACCSDTELEVPPLGVCLLVPKKAHTVLPLPPSIARGFLMCPGPVVVVLASGPANPTWLAGFRTSSTGTKQVVTSHRLVAPPWRTILTSGLWWGHEVGSGGVLGQPCNAL